MLSQSARRSDLLRLVGKTPLLRIRLFHELNPALEVCAKAEWYNPGGSVKDRAALAMIEEGERTGRLDAGQTIIDATSGNTGIAYAWIGAAKGYRVKLVMPENASAERKAIVAAFGAQVEYSSALEGSDGAILRCRAIVTQAPDDYFYPDQYSNPANWQAHYHGTAPEILEQTGGRVDYFLAGLGTTGTFVGTVRRLKEANPALKAVAVMPDDAFHGLEGLKHLPSAIVPPIWVPELADELRGAPTERSYELARRLAREEGILVGHSSGAVLWALEQLARRGARGTAVTVFPDSGLRYLGGLYGAGGS